MSIYKYTLHKYIKAKSTWIISGITFFLAFVIGGFLPFSIFDPVKGGVAQYTLTITATVSTITAFLAVFTTVFAGFKAAAMFKDEVEDGTFLVMLSKPITRSKIILYKWLALQTLFIFYTFFTAFLFASSIAIFDSGNKVPGLKEAGMSTLKSKIAVAALYIWLILFITGLIFSSIALLVSTKLSTGATIGIAIGLGVIIPITSVVGAFTKSAEYQSALALDNKLASRIREGSSAFEKVVSTNPTLKPILDNHKAQSTDSENIFKDFSLTTFISDPYSLYNVGISTRDTDSYKTAFVADINFQIQTLSSFATDTVISKDLRDLASATASQQSSFAQSSTSTRLTEAKNSPYKNKKGGEVQDELDKAIVHSFEQTNPVRVSIIELTNVIVNGVLGSSPTISLVPNSFIVESQNMADTFNKIDPSSNYTVPSFLTNDQFKTLVQKSTEIIRTVDVKSNNDSDIVKLQDAYNGIYYIFDNLQLNRLNSSKKPDFTANNFLSLTESVVELINPIQLWISTETFERTLDGNNAKYDTNNDAVLDATGTYNPASGLQEIGKNQAPHIALTLLKDIRRNTQDADYYSRLLQADHKDGLHLAKIGYENYANKVAILLVYFIIAIILVPASYLVVKNQDFR